MADDIDTAIERIEEVKARVHSASREAAKAAARVVVRNVRANIHNRTGNLSQSVRAGMPRSMGEGWTVDVAPHTVYAHVQEEGALIHAEHHEFLRWVGPAGEVFAHMVNIPGTHYFAKGVAQARKEARQTVAEIENKAARG